MKRLSFLLLLLPQLASAQFLSKSFNLESSDKVVQTRCGQTFSKDTTIMLDNRSRIYGLSINGTSNLENDNNSFIRVTLEDNYNYEYLVYELFPMLSSESTIAFENTAMETVMMDGIVPKKINIHLVNASLTISQINIQTDSNIKKTEDRNISALQKAQGRFIADLLNVNLEKRYALWRADVTSMSEMSYEEKKAMFGGRVPELYGWEYYRRGIFCFPSTEYTSQSFPRNETTSSQYISEWDWRNRHGKNWMTEAKDQGLVCGSCWAFCTIGVIEAYKNLYYNQIIQYNDLSEQELVSCVSGSDCAGGISSDALEYIENYGVVNDSCFPYSASDEDCDNYQNQYLSERVFVESHKVIKESMSDSITVSEDSIKKSLYRCPLTVSYKGHAMVLAGYKVMEENDILPEWHWGWPITVNNNINQHLLGKTAWLIKNSKGTDWGDQGFGYIMGVTNPLYRIFMPLGRITSMQYDDSDIVCEDADGDGYYFWGVGDKPAHCPSWAPDTPDGDDSSINYGPLDDYGYCASLPAGITINTPEIWSSDSTTSYRLGIVNGGTLTITRTTTLTGNAKIRVCEGGILIIDGGALQNADITMVPGGKLIIRHGGLITMASGKRLIAPKGAIIQIEEGHIE